MKIIKNLTIIILFTLGAALLPVVAIDTYYSLALAENFYSIQSPVGILEPKISIEKCKKITMSMYRKSSVTTDAIGVKTLIKGTLINQDNNREVYTETKDLVLNDSQGFKYVEFFTTLPCDLESGNYYIEGNVHFTIRGYNKESPWISDVFPIK